MKFSDINKRYTEVVCSYLQDGYILNAATASGSQGEIAKIDLTKDGVIVRVLMERFHSYEERHSIDGVRIIAGIASAEIPANSENDWFTIWNNRLDVVFEECFYIIGVDSKSGKHYGSKDEATAADELRVKRYIQKHTESKPVCVSEKALEIAKRIIRREFGYNRVSDAEVKISKNKAYVVSYRGQAYRLH